MVDKESLTTKPPYATNCGVLRLHFERVCVASVYRVHTLATLESVHKRIQITLSVHG